MSRIPLLEMDEIPEDYHHLFTDEYLGDRNIFRAWANNPEVLEATLEYLNTLYDQVTPREKELVILAVARASRAEYEWHQHVDIARDVGITIEEMQALGRDDWSVFEHSERDLIEYATAVVEGNVTDAMDEHLEQHYSNSQIVAISLLVDFYVGLDNHIDSMDLPFEGEAFIGWDPDPERVEEIWGPSSQD